MEVFESNHILKFNEQVVYTQENIIVSIVAPTLLMEGASSDTTPICVITYN
jgi:hypothetical protein